MNTNENKQKTEPVGAEALDTQILNALLDESHTNVCVIDYSESTPRALFTRADILKVIEPKLPQPAASAPAQDADLELKVAEAVSSNWYSKKNPHREICKKAILFAFDLLRAELKRNPAQSAEPDAKRYSPFDESPEYHDSVARGQKKPDAKRERNLAFEYIRAIWRNNQLPSPMCEELFQAITKEVGK